MRIKKNKQEKGQGICEMSIYKVTITKTAFVRADNKDEAKELALYDDCIMTDERVINVTKSSRKEIQNMAFGGDHDD